MRKLILTVAFIMISMSAQAGSSRGLIVASNDGPTASVNDQLQQIEPETMAKAAPETTASVNVGAAAKAESNTSPAPAAIDTPIKSQPKPVAKKRETDEQKARRIAAQFGISW